MERSLRAVLVGLSAAGVAAFIGLVGLRIAHPFAFDPAESVWLETAARLAQGQAAYAAPSLDHVPLPGLPLFPAASATLIGLLGVHYWVPRLISALATLATAVLILRMVRLETESLLLGLSAAGLFLGAFAATGASYDLGRPEALAWLFAFAGLAALRTGSGPWSALASAALFALACFTHLAAAWIALAAALHLGVNERPRLMPFALGLVAGVGGGWFLLARSTPWFTFYAWELMQHGLVFDPRRLSLVVGQSVLGALGPLAIAVLLGVALPAPTWRGRSGVWFWAVGGALLAVGFGTAQPAVVSPGIAPAVAALAIAGPWALMRVIHHLAAWPGSERAGRSWVLPGVLVLQFLPLTHGGRALVPDPSAARAYATLVERLRRLPEPVRVVGSPLAARESGHRPALHPVALETLVRARGNRLVASDPTFAIHLLGTLERGPGRPILVTDRSLERMAEGSEIPWDRLARGYDGAMEWPELAGTPAPRYVHAPRAEAVSRDAADTTPADGTMADAGGALADSSTAR